MKSARNLLGAVSMLLLAAACSQGEDGANQAALANDQASAEMNSMMNDPNNPFAQAEMQMNERMMAAVGADASDTWVRKMIEHHRGAVDMSKIVLGQTQDAKVREMAQMTVDKQTREIEELQPLLRQGGAPSPESANLYRASEMEMHNRMMAANGVTVDETWTRKMIEHHRGAVAMSDVVLAQNPPAPVRAKAERTKSDQTREIGDLEVLLRREAPSAAPETASAEPARSGSAVPQPKAAAVPKAAPTPAPKAAPKGASSPAPDPHAGHDMNNMNNMNNM